MKNEKALVVFSGGQDSTTCLFWAKARFTEVETVTFQYGQRHQSEIDAAKKITESQGIAHHVLGVSLLNQLTKSALTDQSLTITDGNEAELPNTFVPGRNLLFFSFAGILAHQIGAKHLITGVSEADYSGYPDCRNDFVQSFNETFNLALDDSYYVHTPLMHLAKKDVWRLADELGVMELIENETVTCYNGIKGQGCRECPACLLRNRGLAQYIEEKGN